MQHFKLQSCSSTQDYLKEKITTVENSFCLASTQSQTRGKGRHGNSWQQFNNGLAFSFLLRPNKVVTLTSLEISILLTEYFNHTIQLKWPNDLLIDRNKCGGILCNIIDDVVIVGIGINLGKIENSNYNFKLPATSIYPERILLPDEYHSIPDQIYSYIINNRIKPEEVLTRWNSLCAHLNIEVIIDSQLGIFTGVGSNGEALLKVNDNQTQSIWSGSLFFND